MNPGPKTPAHLQAELAAIYGRLGLGPVAVASYERERYRLFVETPLGDDVTIEGSYAALVVLASRIVGRTK